MFYFLNIKSVTNYIFKFIRKIFHFKIEMNLPSYFIKSLKLTSLIIRLDFRLKKNWFCQLENQLSELFEIMEHQLIDQGYIDESNRVRMQKGCRKSVTYERAFVGRSAAARASDAADEFLAEVHGVGAVDERVHARVGHGHHEQRVLDPALHVGGALAVEHVPAINYTLS